MRFPWTNAALLFSLAVIAVSGYFGLVSGAEREAWILWSHGIGAYALLVLFIWKSSIIFDAFRRKKRWTRARITFLVTLVLLLVTIGLGLAWTFTGPVYAGGFSLVSLHIYLAIPVMGLIAWHAWRMRFVFRLPETLGRRLFFGSAAAALGGLLLWRTAALFQRVRRFTGSYEWGSYTGRFPAVSWIADRPPPVDAAVWQLRILGAVDRPLQLAYDALLARPAAELDAVLDCTGGWYTAQIWRGVPLGELLAEAGVQDGARSVTIRAVSGYQRRFSLAEARSFLLATHVAGRPLSHGHGAPLRLVAPELRGFEWVKWVSEIEVNTTGPARQSPLPLQ